MISRQKTLCPEEIPCLEGFRLWKPDVWGRFRSPRFLPPSGCAPPIALGCRIKALDTNYLAQTRWDLAPRDRCAASGSNFMRMWLQALPSGATIPATEGSVMDKLIQKGRQTPAGPRLRLKGNGCGCHLAKGRSDGSQRALVRAGSFVIGGLLDDNPQAINDDVSQTDCFSSSLC
jgi:hypothetical protein